MTLKAFILSLFRDFSPGEGFCFCIKLRTNIDPHYNTGNASCKYNNRYVDKDGVFWHSKFLSFMNKRIRLAKDLLTDDGIIVCAIDDYECHNLRHIFDELFGH